MANNGSKILGGIVKLALLTLSSVSLAAEAKKNTKQITKTVSELKNLFKS